MGYIEIDLHGLTWKEAHRTFGEAYSDAFDSNGNPTGDQVRVIHGYGSTGEGGVIRNRLRRFCLRSEEYLEITTGEEIDGNQGCTIVTPNRLLPAAEEVLAEDVWDFCKGMRAHSKVMGKFRRHGHPLTLKAIKSLERQGRLRKHNKRGLVMYEAC